LVNQFKRKSLKTLAGAAAGMTAAGLSPIAFAGSKWTSEGAAVSVTHVDTVFGRTLFIENRSDEVVTLKSFKPGNLSTPTGQFDLNELLVDGDLEIQPATTQAHNISEDGRKHHWAVWDSIESNGRKVKLAGSESPIDVFVYDHSLAARPKAFQYQGYFS